MTDWHPETVVALLRKDAAAAEALAASRCAACGEDAQAWFLLGTARHRLGNESGAVAAFRRATAIDPDDPRAPTALGAMLAASGHAPEALEIFESALQRHPRQPRLLVNAAIVLESLGRDDEALTHYDRAVAAYPGMGDARQNRIALNLRLGRADAADADAARLVGSFPELPAAHYMRAACALASGRLRDALAAYTRATDLDPDYAEAWAGAAVALSALGRLEAASEAHTRALELNAAAVEKFAEPAGEHDRTDGPLFDPRRIYLVAAWERQKNCNWRDHAEVLDAFPAIVDAAAGTPEAVRDRALLFAASVMPVPAATRRRLAADVAAEVLRNAHAEARPFAFAPRPRGRLRIGYISANFRDHPSAHVIAPLFARHDRERFEVRAYSLRADEGPRQRELAMLCDRFVDVSEASDADVARRIHADGIDVLVDLTGYLQFGRAEIVAMRPAPVSVSYIGFPGSLGPGICDYRVTDLVASPNVADEAFSEALIRLPHAHLVCDGSLRVAPLSGGRAAVGLPEDGFVYACHNNSSKIEPEIFALWMRILRAVPASVLWLLAGPPGTDRNLRNAASDHGVAPSRLHFAARVPVDVYRSRLALADLYLDTRAYNGHVTANDALLADLPVLTVRGETWAGRIGSSQVTAAGLAELATSDGSEYVRLATSLAERGEMLAALRGRLARRSGPLFDTAARVRDYERGILAAWERYAAGLAPQSCDVSE